MAPGAVSTVTNPPVAETKSPKSPLKLSFDLHTGGQRVGGSILRGKGFRVFADPQSGARGSLRFLFQQLYRGMPLNEWSGGGGFPAPFEGSVSIDLPTALKPVPPVPAPPTNDALVTVEAASRTNALAVDTTNRDLSIAAILPPPLATNSQTLSNAVTNTGQAVAASQPIEPPVSESVQPAVVEPPPVEYADFTVTCEYDLHTINISIASGGSVLTNLTLWRDNMTDALGNDGPDALAVDHPAVANVAFTPADPLPPSRYVWEGVIGNTSRDLVGPSVHSPWWPISKMVSRGNVAFYTCGYNESKWDVQKIDLANPQVVVTNFSANGRKQNTTLWPVDLAFPDDSTLLVKYSDGNIVAFDPVTTAKRAEHLTNWPASDAPLLEGAAAVAVNPADSNTVAVYYSAAEQVVVYGNTGSPGAWVPKYVIGAQGGYANGPAVAAPTNTADFRQSVKLSHFYYDADGTTNTDARITNAVLCFQQDGKLWVGDPLTSRMLRFDTNGLCDSWFMFVAHTYNAYVDPNDPSRVFAGNLEFSVDYTNAITNCWTLKNCWTRYDSGHELERGKTAQNGLFSVVTLTNNGAPRTFALIRDAAKHNRRKLVELTPAGVRQTYINDIAPFLELEPDGSVTTMTVDPTPQAGTTAYFFRDYLSHWVGSDPVYVRANVGAVNYIDNLCPIYWGAAKLRGSKMFLFYPSKNQFERDVPAIPFTGSHLGSVDLDRSGAWSWLNSPTGPLDGHGSFETNCNYAGSGFTVIDDDIFFAYRGEGWRGGQANQIFHYKTDGTFVGQFGTPVFVQGTLLNAPGAGANVFNISGVKVNGTIYLYTSDEWSHGVHRWRIDPAK